MFKTVKIFPLVAVLALAGAGVALADTDATPQQIYDAVQSGQLVQAQQMVQQVLRDHPGNAKAHYIAAEVAARSGDLAVARQQLAAARQLDPTLSFASARSVSELTAQLSGARTALPYAAQGVAPAPRPASVPWGLIIILGAGGLALWSFFRNRSQRAYGQPYGTVMPPGAPGVAPGYGYGPSYPPMGGGSGLMGGLASGLAIGAGVAAGEELVHHVLDGSSQSGSVPAPGADLRDAPVNSDAGGADFGTSDPNSWGGDAGGGDSGWGGGDGGGWGGDSGGGGDWT